MYIEETNLIKKEWDQVTAQVEHIPVHVVHYTSAGVYVSEYIQKYNDHKISIGGSRGRGYNIPNFHRRVRRGELLPHTPWEKFTITGSSSGLMQQRAPISGGYSITTADPKCAYEDWILTESDLEARAPEYTWYAQNAAAKIQTSGFDALTFLAEFGEIPRMFVSAGKKLLKLDLPKNWRSMSSDWLSVRYGWRPFLRDCHDLYEMVKNANAKMDRSRFSETVGVTHSSSDVNVSTITVAVYKKHHLTVTDSISVGIRGSVTADIEIDQLQFNPLITAWEVVPLSFVIDWFLGVGKSLAAVSFIALNTQYAASAGFQVIQRRTLEMTPEYTNVAYSGEDWQKARCEAIYEVRTPTHVSYTPHFSLHLSPAKILDLVGLMVQRIRR